MAEQRLPLAELPDVELERMLADLGRRLAYPDTPDLATRVGARLRAEPAPSPPRAAPVPFTRRQMVWLAAALALLAIVGTLVIFPEVRFAVADRLGLRGVLIRWVEETPSPAPSPVGARLLLGRQVTLDEARAAVDFPVHLPTVADFAEPSEVYLAGESDDAMVSFVYPAGPGLPAAAETDIGALLTQFRGDVERGFIEKGLVAEGDDAAVRLETVSVDGNPGFWLGGAPHTVFFVCHESGECREERYRLAENVLIWEQDGLTLRLESALSREEALAIAESVRALE